MFYTDHTGEAAMHTAARRSLSSVALTAVFITINHLYSLGPTALMLGAVLLLLPTAFLLWFRNTKSEIAFAGYLLMNLWIVAGFGLAKGFWGDLLRLFVRQTAGGEIGHRVADDARERVDARRARAVIP